jgi:16S rRNA C967 or C1407 C5-methylase (RsmB/RsmF family)/NOL1/NOP2/fmu family ribosome biogenesis protein
MTLPEVFTQRTQPILGEEFAAFVAALETAPPTSVRVNDKLSYQPSDERVAWCEPGYYLAERPLFTADPLFHAGVYYVQEASSMFLYQAIRQHFPEAGAVLDLCAAPGGKSTLISQTLPETSLVVSNEIVRSRAYILAENMIKWGNPNIAITNNEPADFGKLPSFFDAIVVDAPCSGEGMFRKDAGAISEWSLQNVMTCASRQRDILTDVWDSLKTDGILVYSTCTYNREENEENVAWICNELGAEILSIDSSQFPEITVTEGGYRFYPHKTKGEGFFLSVMRKTSSAPNPPKAKKDDKKGTKFVTNQNITVLQLQHPERWVYIVEENLIKAYDKDHLAELQTINKQLKCLHTGIVLGEMKGKDFIPAQSAALSKKLNKESVETVEVDYETAIAYLKKEALYLPDAPKGFLLITYKDQALGWAKNMGNRCNNLYPQEWRIRMNL